MTRTAKRRTAVRARADGVRIPLASYNLADAAACLAVEALKRGGSIDEAAKLMRITQSRLQRIMDASGIKAPEP
ncbi:MAG TPA: hypothetical protein VGB85_31725 [Nannocystis sp.]